MGTAFGLLLLLTLIIVVVGWLTRAVGGQPAPDARDKALAAVVGRQRRAWRRGRR